MGFSVWVIVGLKKKLVLMCGVVKFVLVSVV